MLLAYYDTITNTAIYTNEFPDREKFADRGTSPSISDGVIAFVADEHAYGSDLNGDGDTYDVLLAYLTLDIDGDGIPDGQDACPYEDAMGLDADNDGCIDNISGLTETCDTLLAEGIIAEEMQDSLTTKVENAEKSLNKDNICAAINQLEAFINQVNAQRGNKISDEAADLVIGYANNVIEMLLAELPPGESC